jgi:hypothetical protein
MTVTPAIGVIPGADDPKGLTQHDFVKAKLERNLRTMVEAYKQVGRRDPKWDESAIKFLDGMAKYFANANEDRIYQLPDVPRDVDLCHLGRTALQAGCDDPLVVYCLGAILDDSGEDDEAVPLVRRSIDGLMKSGSARGEPRGHRRERSARQTHPVRRAGLEPRTAPAGTASRLLR